MREGRNVRVEVRGSLNDALREFSRKVDQDGILKQLSRQAYYEKPSVKRRRRRAHKAKTIAKANAERRERMEQYKNSRVVW